MYYHYLKISACFLISIASFFVHHQAQAQCVQITCGLNLMVGNDSAQCGAVVNFTPPLGQYVCNTTADTFYYTGAIEYFVVPANINSVTIDARGAQGSNGFTGPGGLGAQMTGDFTVTPGDSLAILVGQQGLDNNQSGLHQGKSTGGGGGSFVVFNNNPFLVAGGGGGSGNLSVGLDASTGTAGVSSTGPTVGTGGTGGNGGANDAGYNGGGSGGGFFTDGGVPAHDSGTDPNRGGKAYVNGGAGGNNGAHSGGGGYGGGGGGGNYGGGGGGGYSGGGGGCSNGYGGGGGGSFNAGTSQVNTAGVQTGDGLVIISWSIPVPVTTIQIAGLTSGTMFPIGVTTQTFVATDGVDADTCSFTITVNDTVDPFVTAPVDFVTCMDSLQNLAILSGDNCQVNGLQYELLGATTGNGTGDANGVILNAGVTQVVYTVADNGGNIATDTMTVTVIDCSGIEEMAGNTPSVYPNPAQDMLYVDLLTKVPEMELSIMDVQGKLVRAAQYQDQQVISLSLDNMALGMYWIVIRTGEQQWTHKIVKK